MEREPYSQEKVEQGIHEVFDVSKRLDLTALEFYKVVQSIYAASHAAITTNAHDVARAIELLNGGDADAV